MHLFNRFNPAMLRIDVIKPSILGLSFENDYHHKLLPWILSKYFPKYTTHHQERKFSSWWNICYLINTTLQLAYLISIWYSNPSTHGIAIGYLIWIWYSNWSTHIIAIGKITVGGRASEKEVLDLFRRMPDRAWVDIGYLINTILLLCHLIWIWYSNRSTNGITIGCFIWICYFKQNTSKLVTVSLESEFLPFLQFLLFPPFLLFLQVLQ